MAAGCGFISPLLVWFVRWPSSRSSAAAGAGPVGKQVGAAAAAWLEPLAWLEQPAWPEPLAWPEPAVLRGRAATTAAWPEPVASQGSRASLAWPEPVASQGPAAFRGRPATAVQADGSRRRLVWLTSWRPARPTSAWAVMRMRACNATHREPRRKRCRGFLRCVLTRSSQPSPSRTVLLATRLNGAAPADTASATRTPGRTWMAPWWRPDLSIVWAPVPAPAPRVPRRARPSLIVPSPRVTSAGRRSGSMTPVRRAAVPDGIASLDRVINAG